ncbi:MAG: hypothetical protein U0H73_01030 [Ruminococcus sp.]|nr:hypothetical protein [Ruminococcus sp.]
MIKVENTEVYGWEAAIRGMRNPMNSWEKSDSCYCKEPITTKCNNLGCSHCGWAWSDLGKNPFCIGDNDMALMQKLVKAGTDHRKFMRMITVSCDIIAPLYWWKQFDTYKVGTVTDSCSTMHKIAEQEFTLDDFTCEHLFNGAEEGTEFLKDFMYTIKALNKAREKYLETKKKIYWWQMIQMLPESYNQRRTVVLNYEVLRNACQARKNHKLDEWHEFCKWTESLPYSELILEV